MHILPSLSGELNEEALTLVVVAEHTLVWSNCN